MCPSSFCPLRILPRALLLVLALAAPVMALPAITNPGPTSIIEARSNGNSGIGLVLLVSLKRG